MANLLVELVAILSLGASPAVNQASADPAWLVRRSTWVESVVASREALARHEAEAAAAAGAAMLPRLQPWYCLGPLPLAEATAELDGRLVNQPDVAARTEAPTGAEQRWVLRPEYREGWIHHLYEGDHAVYLRRSITAAAARKLSIYLDVTGEMTVWLNGEQVLARRAGQIGYDVWGGDPKVAPTAVPLSLRQGANDLLVKCELQVKPRPADDQDPWRKSTREARRPWGTVFNGHTTHTGPATEYEKLVYREVSNFYCSTHEAPGPTATAAKRNREGIWSFVWNQFPDAATRAEMLREQKQGLWDWDWAAGDVAELARRYAESVRQPDRLAGAQTLAAAATDWSGLQTVRQAYHRAKLVEFGESYLAHDDARRTLRHRIESLRLAIADLTAAHGAAYASGGEFARRLAKVEADVAQAATAGDAEQLADAAASFDQLQREALLANPLLDFERLLLVKRRANPHVADMPFNWANNSSLATDQYDNELAVLSPVGAGNQMTTLYRPEGGNFVGDVDLNFDGQRMLFSMPGSHGRWQVFELRTDGSGLRQVTRGDQEDVDQFDATYLPNGRIVYCSTAMFAGVPCVRGRDFVGVLFSMDADGGNVRQLCFEQDQDYCPTVLHNGRVLYTRWEYADVPHFFSRLLFSMNPDGTDQKSYYGSNSYWPNGIFFAQPIPGSPTQVVGVVSGHHAARRAGELLIFDPARGDHETQGVVQRIPGRGQPVEPVINDRLVIGSWPKFLHPQPLNDKYFLVSCKLNDASRWGIYLVDVFDNMVPLCEDEDHDLLEPIPLRPRATPPVITDRVDQRQREGVVSLTNVYAGPGLADVPPGTIKSLRVVAYHYAYQNMADDSRAIGVDSSWDTVKLVLGTVPVQPDGSAHFRVPANTPLSLQPLDERGRAVQLMRSWMTVMPGETQSCVGCHSSPNAAPPIGSATATEQPPVAIKPWHGPPRGFSYVREVQPVLNQFCVGCHHGQPRPDGSAIVDLTERPSSDPRGFSPSYLELQRYVRRPGAETDYHLLPAAEYHASISELVQMLERGHHNVRLDEEAWDRLFTWIDLNVPFHGTWQEAQGAERLGDQQARRLEMRRLYAGLTDDPEVVVQVPRQSVAPIVPPPEQREPAPAIQLAGWPFDADEAKRRQESGGVPAARSIDLGDGVTMRLMRIPAGEFVMGDAAGAAAERPGRRLIGEAFWVGAFEVTNAQFARFDPQHDSRYIQTHGITSSRGYPINLPDQPVARVSWKQANAFCQWLSERTGEQFQLPSEDMWEYACRAGTATPLYFGGTDADFSPFANLADRQIEHFRDYSHSSPQSWIPREERWDDGAMVTAPVGRYRPNAWGLFDVHGNVAEWTSTPAAALAPGASPTDETHMVVRGGSWLDRPARSQAAFRLDYPRWQRVHNVGFRVVSLARPAVAAAAVSQEGAN